MAGHQERSEGRSEAACGGASLVLRASDRDAIVDQAKREYPNECCGVLLGRDGRVERVHPTANSLRSPVVFQVDPRELLQVLLEAEAASLDVLGYYHSHTGSPAYPSPTDVRYAAGWPGAIHVIVSLSESLPTLRAYRIWAVDEGTADDGGEGPKSTDRERPGVDIREVEVLLR